MRTIFGFLIGFSLGYLGLLTTFTQSNPPRVLAQQIEETPPQSTTVTALPTQTPSPTPSSVPTDKPSQIVRETETPKPTSTSSVRATNTPTPQPTNEPTSTPIPTPVPTQTPVPTPTSTPDVWSPPALEPLFAQYAGMYGVDKNILERIANCESHFNSNAKNGDYLGMFQFSTSTWTNYRNQMGADPNPTLRTNTEESIKTGAFLVSKRGTAPWPSCL